MTLQLFKVNALDPKKQEVNLLQKKSQLNAKQRPPRSFARQKTGLEAKKKNKNKTKLMEHFMKRQISMSSVPSGRMWEPTREGMRTTVLGLGRGHAGHDALDTSRVLWVETWMFRKEERWWQQQKKKERKNEVMPMKTEKGRKLRSPGFLLLTENLVRALTTWAHYTAKWWIPFFFFSFSQLILLDASGHFLPELAWRKVIRLTEWENGGVSKRRHLNCGLRECHCMVNIQLCTNTMFEWTFNKNSISANSVCLTICWLQK